MIAGLFVVLEIKFWRLGRAVFKDEAFHVMRCVLWLRVCVSWICGGGMLGTGGGWEYSCRGSLHFSVSLNKFSGKNGNFSNIAWRLGGSLFCLIKSYISL